MRKTIFGILVGIALGSIGVVLSQTPTIFASIRVNGLSEFRGDLFNSTADLAVDDNFLVTGGTFLQTLQVSSTSDFQGAIANSIGDLTVDDNLVITGTCTGCVTFPISAPNGSFSAPSYSFTNELTGGLYSDGTSVLFGNSNGTDTISALDLDDSEAMLLSANAMTDGFFAINPTTATLELENVTRLIVEADGIETPNVDAAEFGFKGIPQNIQAGNYTLLLEDAARHIYHASGAGAGDTYTIPTNASVAYPIGTVVTFVNDDSNSLAVASGGDTVTLAGGTTVAPCTMTENSMATALKVTSTSWIINGTGITCT